MHKFLRKNGIKFSKAKVIPANRFKSETTSHAYVTLRSAEDRTTAINKLNNIKFKNSVLTVQESNPLPDPLLIMRHKNIKSEQKSIGQSKRGIENDLESVNNKIRKTKISKSTIDQNFEELPEEKRINIINTQVASLWNVPYEHQLSQKATILQKVMKTCFYEFRKICYDLPEGNPNRVEVEQTLNWFGNIQIEGSIIRSPVINGYRNKCEFNIGFDRIVGFRLGLYREGTIKVVNPPTNCPIISEQMHKVLQHFQKYLCEKNIYDGFDPVTHEGYWRQIMVRTTRSKECLISIALHRQQLTGDQLEDEMIKQVKNYFAHNNCGVCSIYFQVINDRSSQVAKAVPKLVDGQEYIYETLMNDSLKFRISPLSFFQVDVFYLRNDCAFN